MPPARSQRHSLAWPVAREHGRLGMASPVAVPLASRVRVTEYEGAARVGVEDDAPSEAGDADLSPPAKPIGGDTPAVGHWQKDTSLGGCLTEASGDPIDLVSGRRGHQCASPPLEELHTATSANIPLLRVPRRNSRTR